MTAAERLKEFLDGIDNYITAKNITPAKLNAEFAFAEEGVPVAETLSLDDMQALNQDDCFGFAYQLMQYVDHIGTERAQCENVIRWCENSLQSIISDFIMNGEWDTYAKHETKVATVLRNDEVARKINEWKLTAQGRLENLKSREYNIRRKADILFEKGKRK